jgi:hypothetical protein
MIVSRTTKSMSINVLITFALLLLIVITVVKYSNQRLVAKYKYSNQQLVVKYNQKGNSWSVANFF